MTVRWGLGTVRNVVDARHLLRAHVSGRTCATSDEIYARRCALPGLEHDARNARPRGSAIPRALAPEPTTNLDVAIEQRPLQERAWIAGCTARQATNRRT